jgi:DNA-binding transcriptional LysR family regulator
MSQMEKGVRQLRYFVEVARCGSFRAAADRLCITQPPLTRQVMALERQLGVQLLRRTTRSVRLTSAGARAEQIFSQCLERFDVAIQNVIYAARSDDTKFRLGMPWWSDLTEIHQIDALARSVLGYDGVETTICPSAVGADHVRDGMLDAALVASPVDTSDLVVERVASLGLLAALPSSHPLANRSSVTLGSLCELPALVMFSPRANPQQHRMFMQYCASMGMAHHRRIFVHDASSMLQYVASGRASALFNDISCANLDFSGIAFRPISAPVELKSQISLVSRPQNPIALTDRLRVAITALLRSTVDIAQSQCKPEDDDPTQNAIRGSA